MKNVFRSFGCALLTLLLMARGASADGIIGDSLESTSAGCDGTTSAMSDGGSAMSDSGSALSDRGRVHLSDPSEILSADGNGLREIGAEGQIAGAEGQIGVVQGRNPPNDDIEAPTQPVSPPGGLWPDGPPRFSYPYSALSPDVTMVPAPVAGAIPDRYGWVQLYQVGELPGSDTRDDWGHFQEFTVDLDWKYTAPLPRTPLVFSFTQEFGYRSLSGVQSPAYISGPPLYQAPVDLPPDMYHIGWDFQLQTAFAGHWNVAAAFNPSLNSDFVSSVNGEAWNWDARVAALYSPQRDLTIVMGVLFWDRIKEQVLPWAGVIWRLTQGWQIDAVFPQIRVSTYLWEEFGFKTSYYGRVEYHSEAYEIFNNEVNAADRVAFKDWRVVMGVNKDRGDFEYFFEGGWVFGRTIQFQNAPEGGLIVESGVIVQAGFRY